MCQHRTNRVRRLSAVALCVAAVGLGSIALAQARGRHTASRTQVLQALAASFVDNFTRAVPIAAIPPGTMTEDEAYQVADFYVSALMRQYGAVAGYKIATFATGAYDRGPVNGLSGPKTAVMLSKGLLPSGAHIDIDCCNMTFVEADFVAEVGHDRINDAHTDVELLSALRGMRPFIEMPDLLEPASGRTDIEAIATNYDFRHGILGDLIPVEATAEGLTRLNTFTYQVTNESGEVLGGGAIADAYAPLYRVRALRDRLRQRGRRLKAGDYLSLGNMGTIRPLKANRYMPDQPLFRGRQATVTYVGLDPRGPASVSVYIDRPRVAASTSRPCARLRQRGADRHRPDVAR